MVCKMNLMAVIAVSAIAGAAWIQGWELTSRIEASADPAIGVQTGTDGDNVDLQKSRSYIFVGKTGLGHEHGVEGKLASGRVNLGANSDAGQLVFDMKSFDADTSAARRYVRLAGVTDASTRQQVNANMKGPAVLDVRRYPTATFRIDSARELREKSRGGEVQYELAGEFTLHGVKRPLRLTVEAITEGSVTRLRGSFQIRQTQFGITPFSKAFGAIGVTDQLRIYGDIYLDADAGPAQDADNDVKPAVQGRGVRR